MYIVIPFIVSREKITPSQPRAVLSAFLSAVPPQDSYFQRKAHFRRPAHKMSLLLRSYFVSPLLSLTRIYQTPISLLSLSCYRKIENHPIPALELLLSSTATQPLLLWRSISFLPWIYQNLRRTCLDMHKSVVYDWMNYHT